MLKHLRSSVLWFALLAQFVHAQRSGSTFSILSESTGSLFAEGNTTTTSFSQIGGSEALQGTFSTTTTNVSGTIGFLGRASTVFTNPASTFTVSGGQGTSPYYNFTDGNGQTPDFGTLLLNRGTTYEFSASGVSTSHPFMVGESYGDMNSSLVSGGPLTGTGGKITLTIPSDFNGSLYYFCTNHSGMVHEFKVRRPNHTADLNSSVALEMIWVEPGTFTMGQDGVATPVHEVTLTQGFYLGKYEVTQAQYEAVMTGNTETNSSGHVISATPSHWPNNPDRPVENVSWEDIQVFLSLLNEQQANNIPAGWAYVLPTEAQWEYACRAGTISAYSWGDGINDEHANGPSSGYAQTRNVGLYPANLWGFFDMHGNVWEWTADASGPYTASSQVDPYNQGGTDSYRVSRGGSWGYSSETLQSARRAFNLSTHRNSGFGFRVGFQIQPDTASPELELFGGADIPHKRDEPWAEPGYGASDLRDGNLTSSVSISGTVDVNTTGTYTLVYSVSDAAGNEANATRTVRVMDYITYDASSLDGALSTISNSGATHVGIEGPEGQDFLLNHSPTIPSGLNVIFHSDQDLYILKPFTYSGEQTITLSAGGSIFVQASITASHSDGKLAAHYGLSEPSVDNSHFFIVAQPINLEMGVNFFSQHGVGGELKSYQIIHELGEENSTTGTDLQGMRAQPNLNYALGRDINASATQVWGKGSFIEENLDINATFFRGFKSFDKSNDFEGLGHKIYDNLNGSLFAHFSNGKISNLHLEVLDNNKLSFDYGGGLLGNSITNGLIVNVHTKGELVSTQSVERQVTFKYSHNLGGLFGTSSSSKLFFCSADLDLTGSSSLGGLIGSATNTHIYNSYSYGTIKGIATGYLYQDLVNNLVDSEFQTNFDSLYVGGLIGRANSSNISNSYSSVSFAWEQDLSGITHHFTYEDNPEWSERTIAGYNNDNYDGYDYYGGLVGHAFNGSNAINSFSNTSPSSLTYGGIINNDIGDDGLRSQSTYTEAGWDFDKIWHISDGEYPIFKWYYKSQEPVDLNTTSALTIVENADIGSLVGEFNATDPNEDAITFQLVGGEGDTHNSLFNLEANGTLRTATIFDYESNASTYSIRVQAMDEHYASVEASFTITLVDDVDEDTDGDGFKDEFEREYGTDIRSAESKPGVKLQIEVMAVGTMEPLVLTPTFSGHPLFGGVKYLLPRVESVGKGYTVLDTPEVFIYRGDQIVTGVTGVATRNSDGTLSLSFEGSAGSEEPVTVTVAHGIPWPGKIGVFRHEHPPLELIPEFTGHYLFGGVRYVLGDVSAIGSHFTSGISPEILLRRGQQDVAGVSILSTTNEDGSLDISFEGSAGSTDPVSLILPDTYSLVDKNKVVTIPFPITDQNFQDEVLLLGSGVGTLEANYTLSGHQDLTEEQEGESRFIHFNFSGQPSSLDTVEAVLFYEDGPNAELVDLNSTTVLSITENQPVGTYIGEFLATHSDGVELTYLLVNGEGDSDNHLFLLETNGTLRSEAIFDYETNASSYLIRVRAESEDGLFSEASFMISLSDADDEPPVISLFGDVNITHEAGTLFHDPGASWADNTDGFGEIFGLGEVNASQPGKYFLIYDHVDQTGNEAESITRTVTILDTTSPVITLNGEPEIILEAGSAFFDPGASWTDMVDGNGVLVGQGEVDTMVPGVYELTYSISDEAGNEAASLIRTVTVVDTMPPVITLTGEPEIILEAGSTYIDPGASWTDIVDGNGTLLGQGEINSLVPGVYELTYSKTDQGGNAAITVMRTVTVVDTMPPVITLTGEPEIILEAGSTYIDPGASWTDIVDGNGTLSGQGEINSLVPGVYQLTYSKTDEAGNAAITVTRTVTVVNDAPNNLVLSGNEVEENLPANTLVGQFSWSDPNDPGGTGNYQLELVNEEGKANFLLDENGTLLTRTSLDFETALSHELVVLLSDAYGGSMEQSFTIEVIDAFLPIVYTEDPIEVGARHVVASGEVMDEGHSLGVSARGFLVSSLAEARVEDAEVIHVLAGEGAGSYTHRVNGLQPDQKYYVRAYATNAEGTAYGASLRLYSQAYDVAPDWSNATPSAYVEGWWSSPWFGTFYTQDDSGWVHHAALGWAYAMPVKDGGVWLWTEATGWAWTEQGTYPFLYANDWQSWLYFYGQSKGQVIFFRYSDHEWVIKVKKEEKQ